MFFFSYGPFKKKLYQHLKELTHQSTTKLKNSPVELGGLSHHLQGFVLPRWLALGFLNHQQYWQTNPSAALSQFPPPRTAAPASLTFFRSSPLFRHGLKERTPSIAVSKIQRPVDSYGEFFPLKCLQLLMW